MMKRKLLLTMLFIVGLLGMSAQTWTPSEVGEGYALLYNVGTGQFLTRGNGWNTQASIGGEGSAMTVVLEKIGEKYKIRALSSKGLECLGGGTVYTDQSQNKNSTWTFTEVDATNHIYNIISADNHGGGSDQYLTAEGGSSTIVGPGNDGTIDNAKWKIFLHADRPAALLEAMKNATEEAPVDVTCFIKDANFGAYSDIAFQCWTVTASNRNLNGGRLTNPCAETFRNGGGKIYQTISVPNGTYKVKCQGFYDPRDGGNTPSILYANDETPVGLKKWASSNASMDGASDVFTNGEYENEIQVVVTTKSLTIGIEGTDGNWTCFDNFRLSYLGPLDLSTYVQGLSDALTAAKAIDPSAPMNTVVAAALAKAISDYDDQSYDNADDYDAAIIAVTTATNDATTSIANYAEAKNILDAANAYDEAGKASYAANATIAAIQTAYDNGDLEAVSADQKTAAATALTTACKVQTTPGADMTDAIINPSFETGDLTGWSVTGYGADTGARATDNNIYKMSGSQGSFLFNTWNNNNGFVISQKDPITGLQPGKYTLSAMMATDASHELYISANGKQATISSSTDGKGTAVSVSITTNITNGTLNIEAGTPDQYWYKADDFRLTFVEAISLQDYYDVIDELVTSASAITGEMSEGAAQNLEQAVSDGQEASGSETDIEKLNEVIEALEAAITAANVSISAKGTIDAMTALVNATNVYTQEAYDEYYGQWITKYNNGTLTSQEAQALQNPSNKTDWHASITVDNFLLSAWNTNPDFVNAPYYINTWSNEGENDGTDFLVPFFEYFTGSGSLGERELTATVTDVEPGYYAVSAWVRNEITGNIDPATATGITFSANDGVEVDVTEGEVVNKFNIGEYTAYAFVDTDGKLTIDFTVNAENNIHWLSFKNVKYEPATEEEVMSSCADALAEAVDRAGKLNGKIPTAAYTELQATVTNNNKDYETIAEYKAAISAIDAATEAKKPLVDPYAEWTVAKTAALEFIGTDEALTAQFTAFNAKVETSTTADAVTGWKNVLVQLVAGWQLVKDCQALAAVTNDNEEANQTFTSAIAAQASAAATAAQKTDHAEALEGVNDAYDNLWDARGTYVTVANPVGDGAKFDLTWMLTNPDVTSFWDGTWGIKPDGWYTDQPDGNFQVMNNGSVNAEDGKHTVFTEYYYLSGGKTYDNGEFNIYIQQTLPAGTYTMSCYAFAKEENYSSGAPKAGVFFYANDTQGSNITSNKLAPAEISFINEAEQEVKIGLKPLEGNTYNWMGIGYVELYKVPTPVIAYDINVAAENATVSVTVDDEEVVQSLPLKTVTLEIEPENDDYYIESVTVTYGDNINVDVANPSEGFYTFQMPEDDVDVSVVAKEYAKATMTITDAKYATFIAPFAVAVPAGVTASTVNGTDADGYTLTLTPVEGNVIPANTPVMLYSEAPVNETFSGIPVGTEDSYTVGWLTGVYAETLAPVGSYVMQNKDGHVAFYRVPEGFTKKVPANRAYLTEASSGINVFYFPGEEGGVTAIEGFDALTSGEFDAIYTASGVKVDALQKGLNIVVKGDKSYKIYVK